MVPHKLIVSPLAYAFVSPYDVSSSGLAKHLVIIRLSSLYSNGVLDVRARTALSWSMVHSLYTCSIVDAMSMFSLVRRSLRTGEPMVFPSTLVERLFYCYRYDHSLDGIKSRATGVRGYSPWLVARRALCPNIILHTVVEMPAKKVRGLGAIDIKTRNNPAHWQSHVVFRMTEKLTSV
jgi:hypothetical protein